MEIFKRGQDTNKFFIDKSSECCYNRNDMMHIEKIKEIIEKHKQEIAEKYHVSEIGVFGSYTRGEQADQSDIDILVSFSKPIGFIKFMRLEFYLTDLLGRKVDLVTKDALKPYIGKMILREIQYV